MNSAPIEYHKWFPYLLCFVLVFYYNKVFTLLYLPQGCLYILWLLTSHLPSKQHNTTLTPQYAPPNKFYPKTSHHPHQQKHSTHHSQQTNHKLNTNITHKTPLPRQPICILLFMLLIPINSIHTKPPTTPNIPYQTTYIQNIYHIIHKATTNTDTPNHNHTKASTIHITHHFTPLNKLLSLHIPINTISHIGNIYYTTHLHLKNPKNKLIQYYTWNNITLILLSGDIHPNPGPITNILKHLPKEYTQRQKQYFLPNTLALKHQYIYLEKVFEPHLTPATSPSQNTPHQELNNIHRHKSILSQHPLHSQIYALIIAYGPTPQICDHQMAEGLDPRCLIILNKLKEIPESTPTHIQHLHNLSHHTSPTTITQAYSHINKLIAKGEVINMATLKQNIPHIPHQILLELIKCTHKVHGYHPTHDTTHTIPSLNTNTNNDNHQTSPLRIITWNTGCISSSLPGIQELARTIHEDPHIILIQETKLHKLKSTTYIDKKFPNYKIIYNNSNTTIPNPNRYSGDNPARGGILTMIPKNIHSNDNITKIPTPITISPYLQVIKIQNKPITPILLINMYMPTHPQDLHLIQEIQNHIQAIVQNHSTHHIILGGDFNRDILLKGRSSNGITSPPQPT